MLIITRFWSEQIVKSTLDRVRQLTSAVDVIPDFGLINSERLTYHINEYLKPYIRHRI
jgi:hypothetical protein